MSISDIILFSLVAAEAVVGAVVFIKFKNGVTSGFNQVQAALKTLGDGLASATSIAAATQSSAVSSVSTVKPVASGRKSVASRPVNRVAGNSSGRVNRIVGSSGK